MGSVVDAAAVRRIPAGTVTFLFSDVEASTRLLQAWGADKFAEALEEHRRVLRRAFARHGGVEQGTEGDSFFVIFARASDAVAAAAEAQVALAEGPLRVRIGVHTGEPLISAGEYVGIDVHRAARIAAAGHGGQVLVSQAVRELVADRFALRDLGSHRLKDLAAPERLYQLGKDDFPPLKSLDQTNLPVPPTAFLGRDRELQEIGALLARSDVRMLTLTGAGGTGKTRLALQAAAEAVDCYPDGRFWVALAPLRDAALVLPTIAQTVGAKDDLSAHLASNRLLLVLDNFEHLLGAATELATLISACPRLTLLVTSREPLHLSAEREYPVLPLVEADAVALFTERARASGVAVAGDGQTRMICRRLDNLPLAIELAAARMKALPPRALLERLEQRLQLLSGGPRDLPERQQTLRSTIAWSHELLSTEEQQLFARLAVFAGGCTLQAAEDVCAAHLDSLHSLVDKSLLRRSDERYWMLETIREYAEERLEQTSEAAGLRQRHTDHFVAFAAQAGEGWRGSDQRLWLERVAAEQGNIRAALAWLEATGQTDALLNAVTDLSLIWDLQGIWLEGRRWLEPALARTEGEKSHARARALRAASSFIRLLGDLDASRTFDEESVALFREFGDPTEIGRSLGNAAVTAELQGDVNRARSLSEEAALQLRRGGDLLNLARVNANLAQYASKDGDHSRAILLLEESRALMRQLGRDEPGLLYHLAAAHLRAGRDAESLTAATESLGAAQGIGDLRFAILAMSVLSTLTARNGDADEAAKLLGAAQAEWARIGLSPELFESTLEDDLRQVFEDEEHQVGIARGRAMDFAEAAEHARAVGARIVAAGAR